MNKYEYSVVELHGPGYDQGETLDGGDGDAREIADVVADRLDHWISRCDTGPGRVDEQPEYEPTLEIVVTRIES